MKRLAEETRIYQHALELKRLFNTEFEDTISMDDEREDLEAAVAEQESAMSAEWCKYAVG